MRRILAPLTGPSTYLRWACLILGGALAMPYMMAGSVVSGVVGASRSPSYPLLTSDPVVFAGVLPLIALSGLFLPVRALELTAARGLLGARIDPSPATSSGAPRGWAERRRTATWFTLHLGVGAVLSGVTLAVVPFAIWLCLLPLVGDPLWFAESGLRAGWRNAWGPVAAAALLVSLVHAVAGAGALLARWAPALLGPSPADRLAALEERTRRLAARNRLARELHDSVGHALSVVTVQAGAAGRVLDRDPGAARAALSAIEESARAALRDLDHVLGLLREEGGGARVPARTLAELPELTRSTGAAAEVTGDLSALPALVSREAYRIVQEALTNAVRHGSGTAVLVAAVREDHLELRVRNPLGETAISRGEEPGSPEEREGREGHGEREGRGGHGGHGGRGLAGVRERVALLGGAFEAGAAGGQWQVDVRLPLRGPEAPARAGMRARPGDAFQDPER